MSRRSMKAVVNSPLFSNLRPKIEINQVTTKRQAILPELNRLACTFAITHLI